MLPKVQSFIFVRHKYLCRFTEEDFMSNEKIAEAVKILGMLEKKFQRIEDSQNLLHEKINKTIEKTIEIISYKENEKNENLIVC